MCVAEPKTRPTGASVLAFLGAVEDQRRREEGFALLDLFGRVTGAPAAMWGPSIVGFGSMAHASSSGEAEWPVVGFSPRKAALSLYGIHGDSGPHEPLLHELGPHSLGKGCLYVKRLDRIDAAVLGRLIANAWSQARG